MSSLKDTEIIVDADGDAWLRVGGKLAGLAPSGRYRVAEAAVAEVERERDELAQQRGDLAAKVLELEQDNRRLTHVLQAAVELTCSASWNPLSSSKAEALEQTLRDCGFIVASDSRPSEQTR